MKVEATVQRIEGNIAYVRRGEGASCCGSGGKEKGASVCGCGGDSVEFRVRVPENWDVRAGDRVKVGAPSYQAILELLSVLLVPVVFYYLFSQGAQILLPSAPDFAAPLAGSLGAFAGLAVQLLLPRVQGNSLPVVQEIVRDFESGPVLAPWSP